MKEKKTYEQPRSEVVELHVNIQLLAGSGGNGTLNAMGEQEDL
jgi:hypothetical protein